MADFEKSLGSAREAFRNWLTESKQLRIDEWNLSVPSHNSTYVRGVGYPGSSAVWEPSVDTSFKVEDDVLYCVTTFRLRVVYRFSKLLPFSLLPVDHAENLQSNVSLAADTEFDTFDAENNIWNVELIPQRSVEVVQHIGSDDWLLVMPIDIRLEIELAEKSDVSKLQENPDATVSADITEFRLALYRSLHEIDPADPLTHTLDRELVVKLPEPAQIELP